MRPISRRAGLATLLAAVCMTTLVSHAEAQSAAAVGPPKAGAFLATAAAIRQSSAAPAKRPDSVLDGVLVGAGIGALVGLIPDYYDDCEECHDSLYVSMAIGAGVGLLVDFLRDGSRTPSRPRPDPAMRLNVAIARKGVGLGGMVRWR